MKRPCQDGKIPVGHPAPAVAGAAPPKNQGNREARSAIYATAAVPILDHIFFALPMWVPVSNCFMFK